MIPLLFFLSGVSFHFRDKKKSSFILQVIEELEKPNGCLKSLVIPILENWAKSIIHDLVVGAKSLIIRARRNFKSYCEFIMRFRIVI